MSRKLNKKRLYKLLVILVWLYAIPTLLYGLWGSFRWESFAREISEGRRECVSMFLDTTMIGTCDSWDKLFDEFEWFMWFALVSGIAVPAIFYGGEAVYRYLFRED